MTRDQLIEAIIKEIERVWGQAGFEGKTDEYAWLLKNYGISQEEDTQWIFILEDGADEDLFDEADIEEIKAFLDDEQAVNTFLKQLLIKYQSNTIAYAHSTNLKH